MFQMNIKKTEYKKLGLALQDNDITTRFLLFLLA